MQLFLLFEFGVSKMDTGVSMLNRGFDVLPLQGLLWELFSIFKLDNLNWFSKLEIVVIVNIFFAVALVLYNVKYFKTMKNPFQVIALVLLIPLHLSSCTIDLWR